MGIDNTLVKLTAKQIKDQAARISGQAVEDRAAAMGEAVVEVIKFRTRKRSWLNRLWDGRSGSINRDEIVQEILNCRSFYLHNPPDEAIINGAREWADINKFYRPLSRLINAAQELPDDTELYVDFDTAESFTLCLSEVQ